MSFDCTRFLSQERACLIAPAGYGKTHAIVECLKCLSGRYLVLTHTHAGVAALRDKMNEADIPSARFELTTISAFGQKISHSYTFVDRIPKQSFNQEDYFRWLSNRMLDLASNEKIREVMQMSYDGVIVDEYQDCTQSQHCFIVSIAKGIPLWVFGDPLQGIFDFNGPIVDFGKDLNGFEKYSLDTPWRWLENNEELGQDILMMRKALENPPVKIDWSALKAIKRMELETDDVYSAVPKYCKDGGQDESRLVITTHKNQRKIVAKRFGGRCTIVEPIDDEVFYNTSRLVDSLSQRSAMTILYSLATTLFFKTEVDNWLTCRGVKTKKHDEDKLESQELSSVVSEYQAEPCPMKLLNCLRALDRINGIRLLLHDQYFALRNAIEMSVERDISVSEAMEKVRNSVRMRGARRMGKLMTGTTLLVKGLEFDHVIVVDANPAFDLSTDSGRKNFYVAVSRARKTLTILSKK